eukprot:CFRG6869T1
MRLRGIHAICSTACGHRRQTKMFPKTLGIKSRKWSVLQRLRSGRNREEVTEMGSLLLTRFFNEDTLNISDTQRDEITKVLMRMSEENIQQIAMKQACPADRLTEAVPSQAQLPLTVKHSLKPSSVSPCANRCDHDTSDCSPSQSTICKQNHMSYANPCTFTNDFLSPAQPQFILPCHNPRKHIDVDNALDVHTSWKVSVLREGVATDTTAHVKSILDCTVPQQNKTRTQSELPTKLRRCKHVKNEIDIGQLSEAVNGELDVSAVSVPKNKSSDVLHMRESEVAEVLPPCVNRALEADSGTLEGNAPTGKVGLYDRSTIPNVDIMETNPNDRVEINNGPSYAQNKLNLYPESTSHSTFSRSDSYLSATRKASKQFCAYCSNSKSLRIVRKPPESTRADIQTQNAGRTDMVRDVGYSNEIYRNQRGSSLSALPIRKNIGEPFTCMSAADVNCESPYIERQLSELSLTPEETRVLDAAQYTIITLMSTDSFPRFLNRKCGIDYLKRLTQTPPARFLRTFKMSLDRFHADNGLVCKADNTYDTWMSMFISIANMLPFCVSIAAKEEEANESNEGPFPLSFVNDYFIEMTGYSYNECVGRNCRFLQGTGTDLCTTRAIREALEAGQSFRGTITNYKKDGTEFQNMISLYPIFDKMGKHVYTIGIQYDAKHNTAVNATLPTVPVMAYLQGRNSVF